MKNLITILTLAAGISATSDALAKTCYYEPRDTTYDGDAHYYVNGWNCSQAWIEFFWNGFDFDKSDWDDGYGYHAPCDLNTPLARTFNAIYALQTSHPTPSWSTTDLAGDPLRWGGSFARKWIDELDGRCEDDEFGTNSLALTNNDGTDHWTRLYWPFFYESTVSERASTLIHEARHAADDNLVGGNPDHTFGCPAGVGCDPYFPDNRTNHFAIAWLADYAWNAINAPDVTRLSAVDRANYLLANRFDQMTTVRIGSAVWDDGSVVGLSSWGPGRLDAFAKTPGGRVEHGWYEDGQWLGWEPLGGIAVADGPVAVSSKPGRIDVFARGKDNKLYHKSWENGWSDWVPRGNANTYLTSAPAVSSWGPDRLDVFARGADGQMYHLWHDPAEGGWHDWQPLGGGLESAPAAVSDVPGRIHVFVRGLDDQLFEKIFWNGQWGEWIPRGGVLTSAPSVSSWGPERLDVFVRGLDGAVYQLFKTTFAGNWQGWFRFETDGPLLSAPAVVSQSTGKIDMVAIFRDVDSGGSTRELRQLSYDQGWPTFEWEKFHDGVCGINDWRCGSGSSPAEPWAEGRTYAVGAIVEFGGDQWKCIQAHTSNSTWTPPIVPALWSLHEEIGSALWAPGRSYDLGDGVYFEGRAYECIQAHVAQDTWPPAATPALWRALD